MKIKYETKNYLNLTTHTALGMSLPVWIKLFFKNKFFIDIRFLPKVLFLTGNIILNIPFQLYEYFRYRKKINETVVKRPVFILGHPRSGTTYLHYVLSKDPDFGFCSTNEALTPHTFLTFGKYTRRILQMAMPATRPQDNVKAGADMPKEEEFAMGNISDTSFVHGFYFPKSLFKVFDRGVIFKESASSLTDWKEHLTFFVKKLTFRYDGKKMMLKSPANTGRVKEILELYPDACFIHIHRDPYAVYQSNEKLYEKILPLLAFQKVKPEFIQDFIIYSYEKMYRKYLNDRAAIPPNQLYELSYDEFVASPIDQVQKMYNHLGIGDFEKARPLFNEEISSVKDYKKNSYIQLEKKSQERINDKWAFFFDAYGYKKQN
ncbi:MAG: hypothetical protein K0S44_2123 [Bacteroidetes bacterium]|jgi:hypothetical protein|nr:hypothetical protein [Bacteroidota bacterium]